MANLGMKQRVFWRLRQGERKFILVSGDIISSLIAMFLALFFWARGTDEWLNFSWQFLIERPPTWFYFLPVVWILLLSGLYDLRKANKLMDTISGIAMSTLMSGSIYLFIFFLATPKTLPRFGVAVFFIGSAIITLIWRLLYIQIFTAPAFMRRVLIVGAGNAGMTLVNIVKESYPPPFFLVGLIDDAPQKIGTELLGFPILGGGSDLLKIIEEKEISDVIFAITGKMNPEMLDALLAAEENGIEITTLPVMYEEIMGRVPIFLLESDWVLRSFVDQSHISRFYEIGKRVIDILGGLIGVIFLIILIPFISLSILISGKGPVFYRQVRLGKNGKEYNIIKFRSMNIDAEIDGIAKPAEENDERITSIGRLLRKSHLDELPQFLNILKGDMSLVGPRSERPEIISGLQSEIPFYRARLFVKPGLTGWAQVNFGYAATVEDNAIKLEYDLYYIKHRNLTLEITILFQTFGAVIGLRGR
jgi:exopolysaccharide biosynthesis polyprenyl glycosylphosphotransferase